MSLQLIDQRSDKLQPQPPSSSTQDTYLVQTCLTLALTNTNKALLKIGPEGPWPKKDAKLVFASAQATYEITRFLLERAVAGWGLNHSMKQRSFFTSDFEKLGKCTSSFERWIPVCLCVTLASEPTVKLYITWCCRKKRESDICTSK